MGTEGSQVAETIGRRGRGRTRAAFDVVGVGGTAGATGNGAAVIVTGEALTAKVSPEGRRIERGAVGVGHGVRADGGRVRLSRGLGDAGAVRRPIGDQCQDGSPSEIYRGAQRRSVDQLFFERAGAAMVLGFGAPEHGMTLLKRYTPAHLTIATCLLGSKSHAASPVRPSP